MKISKINLDIKSIDKDIRTIYEDVIGVRESLSNHWGEGKENPHPISNLQIRNVIVKILEHFGLEVKQVAVPDTNAPQPMIAKTVIVKSKQSNKNK